MKPRAALGAALALFVLGGVLGTALGGRREAGEVVTLKQLLGQVSYEARRIVATVLFMRLDAYVHEGTPVEIGDGRYGFTLANNLDVVPIYRLVTILDPHFLEAYSIAANHLVDALNRTDDAVQLLEEGIRENAADPQVKELHAQLAVILMRDRKDLKGARAHLETALELMARHGDAAKANPDLYKAPVVNGMLIVTCVRMGDLAAGARAAANPHNLAPENPVLVELRQKGLLLPTFDLGVRPLAGDRYGLAPEAQAQASTPQVHDDEHAHDGHHHAPGAHCEERHDTESSVVRTDVKQRPWMEPLGLAMIHWQLSVVGGLAAALLSGLVALRWRRRAVALVALALTALPSHAAPTFEVPAVFSSNWIELFLLFVVVVAIILVLVLNHLVRRGRRLEMAGHEKLFGFVEEALKTNPTDEKHLEVGALSFQNGLYERALSYLSKVSEKNPALKAKAQYYEVLSLLGLSRLAEAASLQDRLALDKLSAAEQYRVARAWKEHNPLGRAKGLFLRVFLTDIAFSDVSQQLEEISLIEKKEQEDSAGFLGRVISPRYRDLKVQSTSEREVVCLAFDRDLTRTVRLRVLKPECADDESVRAFLDEAVLLSRLRHASVLQVYDVNKEKLPYISTEDFEGVALAEWSADLPLGARLALAQQVAQVARDLVGDGKPLASLPRTSLAVGANGSLRVCRAPVGNDRPAAALAGTLAEILPTSDPDEFVTAGLGRVRAALETPGAAHVSGFTQAAEEVRAELAALAEYVALSEADRDRQGLLAHLRWLDDLHRSKVHSLKSKFAVCERYRDEPAKLSRSFFRTANLEEVCRMLASLEEKVTGMTRLPPCRHPAIPRLVRMLGEADLADQRTALAAIAAAGESPSDEVRARMEGLTRELPRWYERYKDLSVSISRVVEEFELDLVRVVELAVASSTYGAQVRLDAAAGDGRVRVADTAEFKRELSLALENLISNSFEARASSLEIEIRRVEADSFRISLRDDGSGVPDDLLERIRTARYTSKEGGTSTGILSAKALVEKHRGRFDIRSRVGAPGTEVTLLIPAA